MAAMITTVDNPYSPERQFDEWRAFDESHGYHSCSLLARLARTSEFFTDEINEKIVEDAIDEIIEFDPLHLYAKVIVSS